MYSSFTSELGLRKESEMSLILSGDENACMCIVDTDKIQKEECKKVIEIHLSLT